MSSIRERLVRNGSWLGLGAIFVIGLGLRLAGLSHDLDAGRMYHVDTYKQVTSVEHFLAGNYYVKMGHPDYDGYPFFNSHLVEYLCRILRPAIESFAGLVGLHGPSSFPSTQSLFWIMRLWNVLLSSLAVLVAFVIGRELYQEKGGMLAALFLALSPVDIAACHYENGDTAAAFFAMLALLFSVRIYKRGGWLDYIGAAATAVMAFSSKYHGGMAVAPCIVAHLLRCGSLRGFFSGRMLLKAAAAAVAALVFFALSNPGIFISPRGTILDMIQFMGWTAKFGMDAEQTGLSVPMRWLFGLKLSYPDLRIILGPVLIPLLLAGVPVLAWNNRVALIPASLPFAYVFLGLAFKPMSNPVYHTVMTGALFVLAAGLIVLIGRMVTLRPLPLVLSATMLAITLASLGLRSQEEAFFFLRNDTQLVFGRWAAENVPPSIWMWTPDSRIGNAFGVPCDDRQYSGRRGEAWVHVLPLPKSFTSKSALTQRFDWHDRALSRFRNVPVGLCVASGELIRENWRLPVFQRVPSTPESDIARVDGIDFYRSTLAFPVSSIKPVTRYVFSATPVENPMVVIRAGAGPLPMTVRVSLGGLESNVFVRPSESAGVVFEHPGGMIPGGRDRFFYRLRIESDLGEAAAVLAFNDEQKGTALFNAGLYGEAVPYLSAAAKANGNPTLHAMHAMAAIMAGRNGQKLPPELRADSTALSGFMEGEWNDDRIFKEYGLSPKYLEGLPYLSFAGQSVLDWGEKSQWKASPPMMLEPGAYKARVLLDSAWNGFLPERLAMALVDQRTLKTYHELEVPIRPAEGWECSAGVAEYGFTVLPGMTACRVLALIPAGGAPGGIGLEIRPDPAGTLAYLQSSLKGTAPVSNPVSPVAAVHCNTVFRNGLALKSFRLDSPVVKAGGSTRLDLYWKTEESMPDIVDQAVWIHFVDKDGKVVFTGDRALAGLLAQREDDGLSVGGGSLVHVPPGTPPGEYSIRLGLWIPNLGYQVGLAKSDAPTVGNGAVLCRLIVEP